MNFPFFVARRYLFTPKSQNVVNLIAYISMIGVLIGSMALIIVMSVFNGFEDLTASLYNTFDPELKITPYHGKTINFDQAQIAQIKALKGVHNVSTCLQENVLIKYEDRQCLALMKGVDSVFMEYSLLKDAVVDGKFVLNHGEIPTAVIGNGLAGKLGLMSLRNFSELLFYVPKRGADVSMNNPAEALQSAAIFPSGIFMVEQSFDDKYVIVSLDFAQDLLDYQQQISAIELILEPDAVLDQVQTEVKKLLGSQFEVKNRFEQNANLYKMMKSEKLMIYLIFVFIIFILSFNIAGSLFMLITEKQKDIRNLIHLGASRKQIRSIFFIEGWLISCIGMCAGLVIGLIICFIQQQFGILRIPGQNMIIDAYPVIIHFTDIVFILFTVGAIGFVISWFSTSYLRNNQMH